MKKNKIFKYAAISVILFLALLFIAKFGGHSLLRIYVEFGTGNCKKIPILCKIPEEIPIIPSMNEGSSLETFDYSFPKMKISLPKGFDVVQETIKRPYYKRKKRQADIPVIYLLYEEPGFFVNLYPQVLKAGVKDNYEFIRNTLYAEPAKIHDTIDAFFVIMKSIFIPDLGDQNTARMVRFSMPGKKGFVNYNFSGKNNYYDCNVISDEGDFFKIYIKDKSETLDLEDVFFIISTATKIN